MGVQNAAGDSGSTSAGFRASDLLELAHRSDSSVTERTLEYWRAQGLLPRPERVGQDGKRPIWSYPGGTADQLSALLRWRRKTKDPDVLRGALWYEGFPVEMARVRDSMGVVLQDVLNVFKKEIAKRTDHPDDPEERWQAVQAIAHTVASKRKGIPRLGRQALSERSAGVALTIGLMIDEPVALERLAADAPFLERLMGVDRAGVSRLAALVHGWTGLPRKVWPALPSWVAYFVCFKCWATPAPLSSSLPAASPAP